MTWPPSPRLPPPLKLRRTSRRPWLLMLYPPPWRRRYAEEVAEMLADRGFSLRIAVDLIAGAIDVWLHPSATLGAAAAAEAHVKEKNMLNRIMRLDCAGAFGMEINCRTTTISIRALE